MATRSRSSTVHTSTIGLTLAVLLSAGCAQAPAASEPPAAAATVSRTAAATVHRETPRVAAPSAPAAPNFTSGDLSRVVVGEKTVPAGLRVDDVTTGYVALSQPMPDGAAAPDDGFVDARLTRIARIAAGDYWDVGGY